MFPNKTKDLSNISPDITQHSSVDIPDGKIETGVDGFRSIVSSNRKSDSNGSEEQVESAVVNVHKADVFGDDFDSVSGDEIKDVPLKPVSIELDDVIGVAFTEIKFSEEILPR
jgi:hypothetical protein